MSEIPTKYQQYLEFFIEHGKDVHPSYAKYLRFFQANDESNPAALSMLEKACNYVTTKSGKKKFQPVSPEILAKEKAEAEAKAKAQSEAIEKDKKESQMKKMADLAERTTSRKKSGKKKTKGK